MERTDAELIEAYKDGDQDALERLVRRHTKPVYGFVLRLVGNAADAEDVAQAAFVNIWRNLEKFDPARSFKTWAYAVARNAAIDHLRKRRNLRFSEIDRLRPEGEGFAETIADAGLSAEELVTKAEDEAELHRALGELGPGEREVIALHAEEERTFEEIGEALGKSPNTVKSQYRRALHKLKKSLAPGRPPAA